MLSTGMRTAILTRPCSQAVPRPVTAVSGLPKKPVAAAPAAPAAPKKATQSAEKPSGLPPSKEKPAETRKAKKEPSLRAPTAYNLFLKEQYAKYKASRPEAAFAEVTKAVSTQWKSMSATAKAPYDAKVAEAKKALGPAIAAAAAKKAEAKRPPNAYAQFVKDNFQNVKSKNPSLTFIQVGGKIKELWTSMAPEKKSFLESRQKQLIEQWQAKNAA